MGVKVLGLKWGRVADCGDKEGLRAAGRVEELGGKDGGGDVRTFNH